MTPSTADRNTHTGVSSWLASLMLRPGGASLTKFALYYGRLNTMSRGWRRRLRRKLAVTVTGAALLLALGGGAAFAQPAAPEATITVINGQVAISANGQCSLIEAINNANNTATGQPHADCAAGNPSGADTINLPSGGLFTLTSVNTTAQGANGLPLITSTITINGNGSTIRRNATAPAFRILHVDYASNLTLNNVRIEGGQSTVGDSGGGVLVNSDAHLTVNNSTITNNSSGQNGGGINARINSYLTITNSQITNNTAENNGGGIYAHDAVTTISLSTISGNEAGNRGGGLAAYNFYADITDSTISDNFALELGGGISSEYAAITVVRSTISGNFSLVGGGLYLQGRENRIVNSTISGNDSEYGGGISTKAPAGYSYRTIVTNSTVTGNNAYYHGGGLDAHGPVTLQRSIIAGNTSGTADEVFSQAGLINADNRNLFGRSGINNAAAFTGFTPSGTDINATSNGTNTPLGSMIGPLANNGGPTQTHALPAGSPARDLGPNTACNGGLMAGIDQRGQPRNQNGSGGSTSNECDSGAFEAGGGGGGGAVSFFASASAAGSVGGLSFAPADIIKFEPGSGWSMFFDGSDVGITKNLSAFEIRTDGTVLLSLAAKQSVSGVGMVMPQDILRFTPTTTGNNTSGAFVMWVDGSTVGLSTTGEKIDALGLSEGAGLAISTSGALAVPKPGGGTLKAQDEDATAYQTTSGTWSALLNLTPIPGMAVEDVNGLWLHPTTGELYVTFAGAFNVAGVAGDAKDIVKLTPSGGAPGGYTASLVYDGSAQGFPQPIDGLEMVP